MREATADTGDIDGFQDTQEPQNIGIDIRDDEDVGGGKNGRW